jgi:hypothetical protein
VKQTIIRSSVLLAIAILTMGGGAGAQDSELPPGHPPLGSGAEGLKTGGVALSIPHVFVETREGGSRTVTRYTLMAVPATGEATGETPREFVFGVPRGASGPPIVEPAGAPGPLSPDRIRRLPDLNAWAIDLPPWEDAIQIKVESFSSEPLSQAGFQQRFFYPVVEMSLLVEPMDLPIAGPGLQFAGVIEAMDVSQWISEPIQAGGVLDFHVHEHGDQGAHGEDMVRTRVETQPNRMNLPRPVLALFFGALLGFALVASQVGRA